MSLAAIVETLRGRLALIRIGNTSPATGQPYNTNIGRFITYGATDEPLPQHAPGINFATMSETQIIGYGKDARQVILQIEAYQVDRNDEILLLSNKMQADLDSALLWDLVGGDYIKTQMLDNTVSELRFARRTPFMLMSQPPLAGLVTEYNFVYNANC